jgi:Na+/H+ antiporter NhaD/arsenite permease-like protein
MQKREGAFKLSLCPFTFSSHFCPPASALLFQTLFPGIFLFSSKRKEKKNKGKKTIKKKKKAEKGGRLLSSSCFAFSLLALTFGLMFLHFCFKHFLLASFSS